MRRHRLILITVLLSFLPAIAVAEQQLESHFQQKLFFISGLYRDNPLTPFDRFNHGDRTFIALVQPQPVASC